MYWSIRREIWENRSIYLAPLIVAAVVMFGSLIATLWLPYKLRNLPATANVHSTITKPFSFAPAPIMLAALIVGAFYAIDALYGERRDRSILFWKSMPVSDTTSVLAKMAIPIIVLPTIALVLSYVVFFALLFAGTVWFGMNGLSPARLWGEVHFVAEPIIMIYGLFAHAIWFAPLYAWLLLLSAWVKRLPLLWVVLPPMGIGMLEKMLFDTQHFKGFMKYRIIGAMGRAFGEKVHTSELEYLNQLTPLRYLATPGLWLGLFFAAGCVAAAIRLRHNREPI
jgi:ABC-2 type transport system permease protein